MFLNCSSRAYHTWALPSWAGEHHDAPKTSECTLASLFRASNEARPILLLGAGASVPSGVPVAAESVRRLARRVYADIVQGGSVPPEQVRLTEWMPWLRSHNWFIKGDDRLAENFPLVVKNLLTPREYRARILRDLFRPSNEIGSGYRNLAGLVLRGLARTILTTNFRYLYSPSPSTSVGLIFPTSQR